MTAAGADIYGNADQFHFAYQQLSGNSGSITAKVVSVSSTHAWAKAGVMIRETLDAGSMHAMMVISATSGAAFQRRTATDAASQSTGQAGIAAPYWVRLTRNGLTFTGEISPDGSDWTTVDSIAVPMGQEAYIGLCLTSHNVNATCTAEFSDVAISGTVSGGWKSQDIGIQSNAPEQLYVVLQDNAGKSAVVKNADPASSATANWAEWNIPLADFTGVNINAIQKMSIGVGDRANTTPGGAGDLYIDDIMLNLPAPEPEPEPEPQPQPEPQPGPDIDLKALGINADFENYTAIGDGVTNTGWASFPGAANGLIADAIPINDEFYTNPSSLGNGWQSNGTAGLNGKYGLAHPNKNNQNDMSDPFNGDFIGYVNLDDGDGFAQSIQSAIVGNLAEGTYTLTVAVAARPNGGWNDVRYEISLVADPVLGAPDNGGPATGSRDGTVLGTVASVTMVPATVVLGSNSQDLVYVLNVDASHPNLGAPFAIRIDVLNALTQDGVPDEGNGGTNYRFTQGNFDNVRLSFQPTELEPEVDLKALGINADFEDYTAIGDGVTNTGWASFPGAANGLIADAIGINDEFWANPSNFGSGWQSNGTAGLNGKYGLQHPNKNNQNDMSDPFNGDFIGFINLDDGDGFTQSIQSAIVGNLAEGTYTLTVAVTARPNGGWNDIQYEISLVADPVLGAPDNGGPATGSRDGTVLGTPASATMVPAAVALGSNNQDLVYVLNVDASHPNLGEPFAIRIDVFNALTQDGVPDEGSGGTNYRFTQGNFDNVRLSFQP